MVCAGEAGRLVRTLHGSALPRDYAIAGIDRKVLCDRRSGCPRMSAAVMVIPGHAVITEVFGTNGCSARTAADSWPHSGLVELLNVSTLHPAGGVACRGWFL